MAAFNIFTSRAVPVRNPANIVAGIMKIRCFCIHAIIFILFIFSFNNKAQQAVGLCVCLFF
jgi:hypothetical protein